MKAAHFFGHALFALDERFDHTDGEATQAGDIAGAMTGANA